MSVPLAAAARLVPAEPPLDPSPDEARSALRRELADPAYYDQDLLTRILDWFDRQLSRGSDLASDAGPLSTLAAMIVGLALVAALALLVSRFRRRARAARERRTVVDDLTVSAAELRARAEAALAAGDHVGALVDGFRALAVRQVERGRLDDLPGSTAREVATALGAEFPDRRDDLGEGALLFDQVLYGERPATAAQATWVLGLDDALAVAR